MEPPDVVAQDAKDVFWIRANGLNLDVVCVTPECQAFGQETTVQYGMGTFNINKLVNTTNCPGCKLAIPKDKVKGLTFFNCHYRVEGLAQLNEQDLFVLEDTGTDTFNPAEHGSWQYLEVVTSVPHQPRTNVVVSSPCILL